MKFLGEKSIIFSMMVAFVGFTNACVDDGTRENPNAGTPGVTAGGLDQDGVPDEHDNCPGVWNPATYSLSMVDQDGNVTVDVTCEVDSDCTGTWVIETPHGTTAVYSVCGDDDYCVVQPDYEWDGIGDMCDDDGDNDGVVNDLDNCDFFSNLDQMNHDGDAMGDACDDNDDGDWVPDEEDNCDFIDNPDQLNTDSLENDDDNVSEAKVDGDDMGDACDPDDDNDNVADREDNCPTWENEDQLDQDGDSVGDACDLDCDNDGIDEVDHLPNWVCAVTDFDGDGWDWDEECNDGNVWVHPGADEVCGDLIDNDCDGLTDAADGDTCACTDDDDCEDDDRCTTDWCDFEGDSEIGTCVHMDNEECPEEGECQNDGHCNDGNPCTTDWCYLPEDGNVMLSYWTCQHDDNTDACNDGNVCTSNDVCSGGVCDGSDNQVSCNDNLWCNGADTCGGGSCSVHAGNPCPGVTGDGDGDCSEVCDEASDSCSLNDNNGSSCNDANACTTGDACSSGQCVGTPIQECGVVDLHGDTPPGVGGGNGGPNADGTDDAKDDDGDCYCETAPCTSSVNSACGPLLGGDCDDDPDDSAMTVRNPGPNHFSSDGSYYNNPGTDGHQPNGNEWWDDNYDNDCDNVVDDGFPAN